MLIHIYVGTAAHIESYSRVQGSSLVVTRPWNGVYQDLATLGLPVCYTEP